MKLKSKAWVLFLLLVGTCLLSSCGNNPSIVQGLAPSDQKDSISVSGVGSVTVVPDICYISISVHVERPGAAEAVFDNNTATLNVIDAIKSVGVEQSDIRTMDFSLWQNTQYDTAGIPFNSSTTVNNTVVVTVRNVENVGTVMDKVTAAGSYMINSIQYDLSNKSEALRQARLEALSKAKMNAEELAAASGVVLGPITKIVYTNTPSNFSSYKGAEGMGGNGAQFYSGKMFITADVSVTYQIK